MKDSMPPKMSYNDLDPVWLRSGDETGVRQAVINSTSYPCCSCQSPKWPK